MEKVRLETASGHLAAIGLLPPFKTRPEVVIWGNRIFQRQIVSYVEDTIAYREIAVVVITETVEPWSAEEKA